MSDTSTTFGGWRDRLTYLLAEGQLVVLGLLFSLGVLIWVVKPSIPRVPPITQGIFAAALLFGPPLFGLFVTAIRKLRRRNMVEVHHINGRQDLAKQYYVEPEIWAEKTIDGPNPYPVNGGTAWAVQEFEELKDVGELRVKGVWLEECQDTKLMTSKSHMDAIYEKLTESHIALHILRDSVSEFGADIQRRIINRMAEARECGKMMDKSAVKEVFENFEEQASGVGDDDLPTLEPDDPIGDQDEFVDDALEDVGMGEMHDQPQPAAADGGSDQ